MKSPNIFLTFFSPHLAILSGVRYFLPAASKKGFNLLGTVICSHVAFNRLRDLHPTPCGEKPTFTRLPIPPRNFFVHYEQAARHYESRGVKKALQFHFAMYPNFSPLGFCGLGRDDGTRTHGLLVPNQAFYQTELHPDKLSVNIYRQLRVSPHCFQYGVLHPSSANPEADASLLIG